MSSELSYILDPGSNIAPVRPQTTQNGPFIGASPITSNATLFYESPLWRARVHGLPRQIRDDVPHCLWRLRSR
jgi:hypothetical protein